MISRFFLASVSAVTVDAAFSSVKQIRERLASVHVRRRGCDRMRRVRFRIDTIMQLHAEMPLIAFLRLVHLRIARLLFDLRRTRSCDDRRVEIVPVEILMPFFLRYALTTANSALPRLLRSRRWRNLQIVVSSETRACLRSMAGNVRMEMISFNDFSAPEPPRLNHCCKKWIRSIRSSVTGALPEKPVEYYGRTTSHSSSHGVIRSISLRKIARFVAFANCSKGKLANEICSSPVTVIIAELNPFF